MKQSHLPDRAHHGQSDALEDSFLVCQLADAVDERLVGAKARNLARLIALGIPVPDGFVLTRSAFDLFLDVNGLRQEIDSLCFDIDPMDLAGLQARSAAIAAFVTQAAMPQQIGRVLQEVSTRLQVGSTAELRLKLPRVMLPLPRKGGEGWGEGRCLVARSSGIGEDSAHASFAGQLDSVLGLQSVADLDRGVTTCWASYWSERALFYRVARAASLDGMGVIVQRQVPARVSGVLFTRAPAGTPGASPDDLVLEYCAGLGDALVSGRVEPGRMIVSRDDWSVRSVTAPPAVPAADIEAFLTPRRILDLARLALRLETELGAPQDIEWSIDLNGQLWILQARPITVMRERGEQERRTAIWSNANVNENFPDPISPFLYSIAAPGYYHYFRNLGLAFGVSRRRLSAMDQALAGIIGVHGGRMYYNLTNIHAVLRMAPFGERLARAFNQFVGAAEIAAPPSGALEWGEGSRSVAAGELLRIAVQTTWQYLILRRRLESFERTADRFANRTHPARLQKRCLRELLVDLRGFVNIRNHRWKNASLADAAAMVCYALLQRALKGVGDGSTLHNRLLRALPGVPSSIPPRRLWELSEMIRSDKTLRVLFASESAPNALSAIRHDERFAAFRRAFEQFLDEWGFRSSAELMLTVPSLQEDPLPAIEMLRQYADSAGEPPDNVMARQASDRLAETSRLLRKLIRRSPAKAAAVWLLLRWTQRAIAYRERARLKQALLYTRCRRIALAIGERFVQTGMLRHADDVFMLTFPEIEELGSGRAMFPYGVHELVALRRREHGALGAMRPPDTIQLAEGEYLQIGVDATGEPSDEFHVKDGAAQTMRGTSACGGRAEARAAVLADIREAGRLRRGEVLVTRQTDPGWGPVFCLISGLVIERGGMLSHGAIIAREFGLPCIVGVPHATRRIPDGAHVIVDGDLGLCTVSNQGQSLAPASQACIEAAHD
jgi:pyruvate,water dikinase